LEISLFSKLAPIDSFSVACAYMIEEETVLKLSARENGI
jgi:hypothetical protein